MRLATAHLQNFKPHIAGPSQLQSQSHQMMTILMKAPPRSPAGQDGEIHTPDQRVRWAPRALRSTGVRGLGTSNGSVRFRLGSVYGLEAQGNGRKRKLSRQCATTPEKKPSLGFRADSRAGLKPRLAPTSVQAWDALFAGYCHARRAPSPARPNRPNLPAPLYDVLSGLIGSGRQAASILEASLHLIALTSNWRRPEDHKQQPTCTAKKTSGQCLTLSLTCSICAGFGLQTAWRTRRISIISKKHT